MNDRRGGKFRNSVYYRQPKHKPNKSCKTIFDAVEEFRKAGAGDDAVIHYMDKDGNIVSQKVNEMNKDIEDYEKENSNNI